MRKNLNKFFIAVFLSALAVYPAFASEAAIRLVGYAPQEVHDLELETEKSMPLTAIGVGQPVYMTSEHEGTYAWSLTAPDGSATTLSSATEREIYLIPDMVGSYVVTLDFTDSESVSSSDEITITGANYVGMGGLGGAALSMGQCAMCHAPKVALWEETDHKSLFELGIDGIASSHYGEGCIECHTTGYDTLAVNGGFDDVAAAEGWTFPDSMMAGNFDDLLTNYPQTAQLATIGCESCHGPGSEHNGVVAKTAVSYDAGVCSYCHYEETHHVYPNEWQHSGHGQHMEADEHYNRSSSGCAACHTAEDFFAVNVSDDHESNAPYAVLHGITCQVCHDPHDATGEHQLRIAEDYYYTDQTGESKYKTDGTTATSCDICHHLRVGTDVPGSAPHHNPQTDMLNGEVGYQNPAKTFPETNPHNAGIEGRCAGCHMAETPEGKYPYVGGHTFAMHAAADAENGPETELYLTEACAECHPDIGEDFDYRGIQTKVKLMLNELANRLPVATVGRLAGTVPAYDQEEVDDGTITVDQMNAAYNYLIVDYDGSYGVHNAGMAVALLEDALEIAPKSDECLACDINGDGRLGISDVVKLILNARDDETAACIDRNDDYEYDQLDVVQLVNEIWGGTCPEATMLASAGVEIVASAEKMELTDDQIRYVESMIAQMDLTVEQEEAFRTALYGQGGAMSSLPKAFALAQNAPNPFNPATSINYSVPEGTSQAVRLAVYDIRGKLVRTLVDQVKSAGTYTVFWDGTDESGVQVSSGVYFYRMVSGSFIQTRKMVLLK